MIFCSMVTPALNIADPLIAGKVGQAAPPNSVGLAAD